MFEAWVALAIFLLGQLCTLVWMLSGICTQLKNIVERLERIEAQSNNYYPNKDGIRLETSLNALWDKYDKCGSCHNGNTHE